MSGFADIRRLLDGRLRPLRNRLRWSMQHAHILADHFSRYARLMRLHQPIGIWLLLWPTLWAIWIASDGQPNQQLFGVFVLGTIIVRSAGCIINDFADRKIDPSVARTANRPIATGEVASAEALILFVGMMLIAFGLVLSMNKLTVQLAVGGAAIAVIYPFMKRLVSAPQFVLGVAFAWGVPMAFAAQLATVPRLGWLIFLTALIWVVIYDTQYAMVDKEDDLKVGVHSTAILFGDMDRVFIAGLQLMFFIGLGLVGDSAEMGRWYYGGLALAIILALRQQYLIKDRDPELCFVAFSNNAWLGGCIFCAVLLDYTFRS